MAGCVEWMCYHVKHNANPNVDSIMMGEKTAELYQEKSSLIREGAARD